MPPTDEGRMIAEATSGVLGDLPRETWDAVERGEWPAAAWQAVAEAGLPLALVPESRGGYGLSAVDALAVVRLAGQFATPLPLAESVLANWLLSQGGLAPAEGPVTFAATDTPLQGVGDGWSVSGEISRIPWARHCGLVLLAPSADGAKIVSLARGDVAITPGLNLAGEPRDDVRIDVTAPAESVGAIDLTHAQLRSAGAVMRSLQIAGALDEVLRMTVTHTTERKQFGRALGAFQAIQHQVAVMASQTSAASVAADLAIEGFVGGLEPRAIAAAKSRTGEAAGTCVSIAHQIHGAMGFTREFRLQLLTRRLWAWRDEFGGEAEWNRALGHSLAGAGADGLWSKLTEI